MSSVKLDSERVEANPPGAFTGVRVLDLSMYLAGPYCSRLMADMGADIVKIEPPSGDFLRSAPPMRDGSSAYFGHLNCGKRSVCIDLKQPEGIEIIKRLLEETDVLLENFRPGVMARFGLDYEAVKLIKPDIVYCSVSGYGQTGPSASLPAFAPIIHASSGFEMQSIRYEADIERPIANRNCMADYLAATHALAGIGAALFRRATTGKGDYLDVALMDTVHNAMGYEYVDAQFPGQPTPTFRPMRTLDGFIAMAPVSEPNFRALARAANSSHWLEDPRFVTREKRIGHWQEFLDVIELWTQTVTSDDAESNLAREGCPASIYRSIADSQVDPQVRVRGSAVDVEDTSGTFQVANCPIKFTDAIANAGKNVPELGEHADEVLAAAGCSAEKIKALRGANVII